MLVVREVYSDWAHERRGTLRIQRADKIGAAPPPPDAALLAKRYGVAGKILLSRLRTFLAFPEWFYLKEPVNTMTPPRRDARRPGDAVLLRRSFRPATRTRR